ncbi:MAG: SDR family NAD(P)-dependent oxidoreductase [Cyanobacteria bacterium SZAS-4]|nr:SDR family NAD(P)-dependent oxidoreductase [Cyanobacteria bacterium SZAS-4]
MKLQGNTILITGGTSGIGRGLAEAFHKLGNKVIIAGRRQNLLDEVAKANPGIEGLQLDLENTSGITKFAETVKQKYPELNVLINNAGVAKFENWTDGDLNMDEIVSTIDTNITSVIRLTAALLPVLSSKKNATIMATTSGLAFVPLTKAPTYSATKAFLHSWLQSVRFQLEDKVEVLELPPPYVATELGGQAQAQDPRAMPLNEYVEEVISILQNSDIKEGEILVERVRELRMAERTNQYEKTFATLNTMFN